MRVLRHVAGPACLSIAALLLASSGVRAESMQSALARAYADNPQLNAQRANVRATDENVPQALSGYRPKVGATVTVGEQRNDITDTSLTPPTVYTPLHDTVTTYSYGLTATQTIFNGFQTTNRTRAAESQVSGAREGLRVMEQTILLNAATIYMDVLRDGAVVRIQQSNVAALRQVLDQTRKRFSVGDVTATDVSQAQAQLASAEISLAGGTSAAVDVES